MEQNPEQQTHEKRDNKEDVSSIRPDNIHVATWNWLKLQPFSLSRFTTLTHFTHSLLNHFRTSILNFSTYKPTSLHHRLLRVIYSFFLFLFLFIHTPFQSHALTHTASIQSLSAL